MEKQEVKELALDLMFEVSDDEAQEIVEDFKLLDEMLSFFEEIDTTGVEEMIYPYDIETSYLREDEVSNVITNEEALSNVSKVKEGHVVVPKVVK